MDDLMLHARLDEYTTLTVSPLDDLTYSEFVEDDTLGGSRGYFVLRSSRRDCQPKFEILAKAPSFEAASRIFEMIVAASQRHQYA